MMSENRFRLDEEFQHLKQIRDEIRVQLNLGKREVEDKWNELDARWGELENKMVLFNRFTAQTADEVGEAVDVVMEEARDGLHDTAEDVRAAAYLLLEEMREGFKRMKAGL